MRLVRSQFLIFAAAAVCLSGCSDKVKEAVKKGKEGVKKAVNNAPPIPSVPGVAPLVGKKSGSMEFTLDQPTKVGQCFISLISLPSGKVFQVSSVSDGGTETFPSVLITGQVGTGTVDALANQKVTGQMFVQTTQNGPIWHSASGTPAEVTVSSIKEGMAECAVNAQLVNTQTGQTTAVTGKFSGPIK